MPTRRTFLTCLAALAASGAPDGPAAALQPVSAVGLDTPEGTALLERIRRGGTVMFIRHADTAGEPCDAYGDAREDQRNVSPAGREQAVTLGARIEALGIPVAKPVLAGPVFRARDTAELAFGVDGVRVTDSLLADDYAGGRLDWVLSEHRRLFGAPVPEGENRVLVGHRFPAQMIFGSVLSGTSLPEAGVLVLEPRGDGAAEILGVLAIVPVLGDGNPRCRPR
ncbi:histidine phosphatase family protein [uncultured Jannaschia sp.]|uniref:histidine phosphatase family protein n=1 Tax=uncultured Jannaschia sp. TaxID=293347 RepID=UPI00261B6DB4|nr:histidine phosphatase family protein [uncultured Jannaschia sp.]